MRKMKTKIIPESQKSEPSEPQVNEKLKIGIYSLTACDGCQLKLATMSRMPEIWSVFDFRHYGLVSSEGSVHEDVYVAFVEGSVSTEKDLEELKAIRKQTKHLVAFGACSVHGGVQSWAEGDKSYDDLYKEVYGNDKIDMQGLQAKPIEYHVKVDYVLPGCPPESDEIYYFLSTFLWGTWPELKDYPVCQECRKNGNPCILIEDGAPCLGPVTTAGCNSRCINYNVPCIGCRGPVPHENAWFDSLAKTFLDKGFSQDFIAKRMKIFCAHDPMINERLNIIFGDNKND